MLGMNSSKLRGQLLPSSGSSRYDKGLTCSLLPRSFYQSASLRTGGRSSASDFPRWNTIAAWASRQDKLAAGRRLFGNT